MLLMSTNLKNKLKWSILTLIFLIAWVICLITLAKGMINTVKDWFCLVFFTLIFFLFLFVLIKIFKGYKVVEFTDEYLVIFDFFGRKTLIPWNKIEGFGTWRTGYQNQIKVFTRDTEKEIANMPSAFRRFTARVDYKVTGAIFFILEDLGGGNMKELFEKCNQELKKHQKTKQIKH